MGLSQPQWYRSNPHISAIYQPQRMNYNELWRTHKYSINNNKSALKTLTKATEKWLKNIYFIVSINKQEANQNLRERTTTSKPLRKQHSKDRRVRERGRRGCAEVTKQFSTRLSVGLDFFITHTHTHMQARTHPSMHTHTCTRNDRENHKILTNLLKVYTLPLDFAGRQKLVPWLEPELKAEAERGRRPSWESVKSTIERQRFSHLNIKEIYEHTHTHKHTHTGQGRAERGARRRRRRTCFMHAPRKVRYRKIKLTYVNKTSSRNGLCVCVGGRAVRKLCSNLI